MTDRFRSALLIGLGDAGSVPALKTWHMLVQGDPEAAALVQCGCLTGTGAFVDARSGQAMLTLAGLDPNLTALQSNFRIIEEADEAIQSAIETLLSETRDQRARIALEERGTRIDSGVSVYIFAALSDPIGGAALLPVLTGLRRAARRVIRGIPITPDVVALLPAQAAPKAECARAYTAIQELDWAADNPQEVMSEDATFADMIYLLGEQNEAGFQLESFAAVADVTAEVITAILERRLMTDRSSGVSLLNDKEGKRTRYSSFGLGKLTYPAPDMREMVGAYLETRLCEAIGLSPGHVWDAELLSAETNKFADAGKLEDLMTAMSRNVDGSAAWPGFTASLRFDERTFIDDAETRIREDAVEFERGTLPGLIQGLGRRRTALHQRVIDVWTQRVAALCDDSETGLSYARGFAACFLAEPSGFSRGTPVTKTRSLPLLEGLAKQPFDVIAGIDRVLPDRLGRDLVAKVEALQALATALEIANPDDVDYDVKVDRQATLEKEIAELSAKHAAAVTRVTEFDLVLQDATNRRGLLARHDSNPGPEDDAIEAARAADAAFQAAARIHEEAVERRAETFRRWFVIQPVLGALAFATTLGVLMWAGVWSGRLWLDVMRTMVGGAVIYFGWRAWLFREVNEQVRRAERHKDHAAASKKQALWNINTWHANRLRDEFERALWSTSYSLIEDLRTDFTSARQTLDAFGDAVDAHHAAATRIWSTHQIPATMAVRPLFQSADVEALVRARKERIDLEVAQQASRKRASFYLAAFGELGTLASVRASAQDCLEQVCGSLLRMPAADVLLQEPEHLPVRKVSDRLQVLNSMSKALMQLDVEQGDDSSDPLYYFGGGDADEHLLRELSALTGTTISPFHVRDRQALTLCKFKVGFPAFQVSALRIGRDALAGFDDQAAFYAMPDARLPDLLPTLHTIGSEDDPIRRLLCLGTNLGLIVEADGRFAIADGMLGETLEDCAKTLRRITSRKLKEALAASIDRELANPDTIDTLLARLKAGLADPIDMAIIKREIDGLSTLS